ncbi:MAG: flavodoxin family protein [Smithella sp.]|jgi:multimeric flavodoxin WrbA
MKLLALNASHKKTGGNTQQIIDALMAGAVLCGAAVETIRLSKYDIRPCLACDYCQKQDHYGCVHDEKDDFVDILEKCKGADVIIYATPIYVFQISSKLKTFLERIHSRGKAGIRTFSKANLLFHDMERDVLRNPFVSIITADNVEKETTCGAKRFFEAFSLFMDAPHVGSIVRNGCALLFNGGNNEYNGKLKEILADTQEAGKCLSVNGFIPKRLEKRISKNVLPIPVPLFNILKRTKTGRQKLLTRSNG